jgi:hypothetical protein
MAPHCANTIDQALVTTLLSTIKETAFDMVAWLRVPSTSLPS